MGNTRVKISSVIENQLPDFVKEEFPLVEEFLSTYYSSLEYQSGALDILNNIDEYVKIDNLTKLTSSTKTTSSISLTDDTINVVSTGGFPNSYGLIQIDNEIITYTSKTNTSFNGCVRGFSGVTSYENPSRKDHLVFSTSQINEHLEGSTVTNLSILFLKEFFIKIKKQFAPGFEDRKLYSDLNQDIFIKQSKDFYSSKGTDQSFKILFKALYGDEIEVIKPRDYLLIPSNAQYRIVKDLVVEAIEGDPEKIVNRTLFQDKTDFFQKAFGSINNVERIIRGEKEYYVLSLDYNPNESNSNSGEFSIHPITKTITPVSIGSSVIDVDSTLGFPNSGTLIADLNNGTSISISYKSKSYTQFYECSGISQVIPQTQDIRIDSYAYAYSGIGTNNIVKVRVTGVLSDINLGSDTKLFSEGNNIKIKTLGKYSEDIVANNWMFNVATRYQIDSLVLIDTQNFTYQVKTFDANDFHIGDRISVFLTDGTKIESTIISISNPKSFNISGQGEIDTTKKDWVHRVLSKGKFQNFPEASVYTANVQNVYVDNLGNYLVTSSSIPNYFNSQLETKKRSVTFSGTFDYSENINVGQHNFLTGDSIFYKPKSTENSLNISEGIYFVKKVDSSTIKLSRSRENLYKNIYISLTGTVTDNEIVMSDQANKYLQSQKLVKKLKKPQEVSEVNETKTGTIGILANGVEILNYKSDDTVFYGPLEKINVLASGEDYDVITPPVLSISDSVGTGASAYCEVEGLFENIVVIDGGFDYLKPPTVSITGGSGSGAIAEVDLFPVEHTVSFNSTESIGLVNLANNTIGFTTYHKFRDAEGIIYKTKGQQSIGGLSTDSTYYTYVIDSNTITLHKTYEDALVGINTVDLTSYGVGIHNFSSQIIKKKVSSIKITNPGKGYRNRKISVFPSGISTSSNSVFAPNHNYKTGEIVVYSTTGQEIVGLSSGKSYYVTSIDENYFKLSRVGTALTVGIGSAVVGVTTTQDFYYKTKQFVNFKTKGSGIHNFNYEPITVKLDGIIGVSSRTNQNFNAIVQPIVRGEIKSVFIETGGFGYGSEDILNFNRQATFTLKTGKNAQLLPIVSGDKISQVIIIKGGSEYNSPPSLEIVGKGFGAILSPVISNGSISEIKVINGGQGFTTATTAINVIPSGSGAAFQSVPKTWKINLVQKNLTDNIISDDDGIIHPEIGSKYGLAYTHAYAPRYLRRILGRISNLNDTEIFTPDLRLDAGVELLSNTHSPIIGWAYDGNPIYGPYGHSTSSGGPIKLLKSGYTLSLKSERPSTSTYSAGFFVEDYEYTNSGDLDEFNGRFGVTPEYPKGTYAYFATIDTNNNEQSGSFRNYRKPVFPYLIGNKFKSIPIDYNFKLTSNQDEVDLNKTEFFRNTKPYKLQNNRSGYYFLTQPEKIKSQNSIVKKTSVGFIDSVGITSSGKNYKIGDRIIFNNQGTGGQEASFEVSQLKGKVVNQVSSSTTSILNVEFYPSNFGGNTFIGFSYSPHNLSDFDIINVSGISTFGSGLNGSYRVGVRTDTLVLVSAADSITSTGIVTYFEVAGFLGYPYIRENDILEIETEKVKVLNIEPELKRIRVVRGYENTVGSSHSISSLLSQRSRKFEITSGVITSIYSRSLNQEIYFNPSDSVGLGTINGIGIGHTLVFSNPGFGRTTLFIPTKSIFLPDHNLLTGDSLIYSNNGGTSISVSTDGQSSFELLNNQIVYAAVTKNNLIGIATNPIGIGSAGNFVGINTEIFTNTLFFTGIGTGVVHSFKTDYKDIIVGKVDKNLVTVSTASSHGLQVNDRVTMLTLSQLSVNYAIKYNGYHRRMVVNPKDFLTSDVDTIKDTITIVSHGYKTGQKAIYTSNSPVGGLENNQIYFILVIDENKIKLTTTYHETTLSEPNYINLTSTGNGTLSLINPKIEVFRNQSVIFDLSDSSLSHLINSIPYPSFDFKLYTDQKLKNTIESSGVQNSFEIVKSGTVGITTDAKVTLSVSNTLPKVLYYGLEPINTNTNYAENNEIIRDFEDIIENNKIEIKDSVYSGSHLISGITSTTFSYNTKDKPERVSYLSSEAKLSYTTDSFFADGEIDNFKFISGGNQYKFLPKITSIASSEGKFALVVPKSSSVGKIVATEIEDIGFEYSADNTIRPTIKLPYIVRVDPLLSINRIGITSVGKNYNIAPDLILIDSTRNEVIDDVDLTFDLGDRVVTVIRDTAKLSDQQPIILPINNSNGIGINSITFNPATKDVIVSLASTYSNSEDFPFSVGDEVLIEGTSVGIGTTLRGYNSSSYGYSLFSLTSANVNIGGYPYVTYNLSEYLNGNENPGVFVNQNLSAKIVPKKFFPIFEADLLYNNFFNKEEVKSKNSIGIVDEWDSISKSLKIFSDETFIVGETIRGSSSNTHAIILSVEKYEADYSVSSNSIVKKGFQTQSGFLNNDYQKIHDSDYYQFFSYSIKSKVEYNKWDEVVTSQNHTLGFKKFGDLVVESGIDSFTGISTTQDFGEIDVESFSPQVVGFNCVNDFDFVKEKTITIDSEILSNEIIFQNTEVSNYTQVLNNRVLIVDDISNQFNSEERSSRSVAVNSFKRNTNRSKKYIIDVFDRRFSSEKQISLVTILHDGNYAHINQYARVETVGDLGSFDVSFIGNEANLLFYPNQYKTNNFNINYISYDLENDASGISTIFLGNIVEIKTSNYTISENDTNATNIVSIASSYRASKILVQISSDNNTFYEYNEISVIHDGTDVVFLEYGSFNNNITSSSSGFGTYGAYLSGSTLNISFTPNVGFNTSCTVNSVVYSLANDSTSINSGYLNVSTNRLKSNYVSVGATAIPGENVICEYDKRDFNSSYYIISISDKVNNRHQMSEVVVASTNVDANILEFGKIYTDLNLGEVSAKITGDNVQLCFIPIQNTELEVRVFENILGVGITDPGASRIDLLSGSVETGNAIYNSTSSEVRREFDLLYKQLPIFQRTFDGNNPSIVNITDSTIRLPNHFFVTGERVTYSYEGELARPIGIAETSFAGIGVTDKLHSNLYVVKINDSTIKLASTAQNALKEVPQVLNITSVGIGSIHKLTSTNQNSKSLITIDNVIQSPIVSTAVTSTLAAPLLISDDFVRLSGITSIFGGDLLKIDDEIMKVRSVGYGQTNSILVDRSWMGTGISTHSQNSLVTKLFGSYNITNNKINFINPPYGPTPVPTSANNETDWTGITTHSTFSGRIFLRSGFKNTASEAYSTNYILDDISDSFNGIKTDFILKSNKNNLSGIVTSNGILLINQVAQSPQRLTIPKTIIGDYLLEESAGITTITFTGSTPTSSYDINSTNVPKGGIIVSVASTGGFGYQPLVAAGGTAIVSAAGTISSISIGNSGSGYRAGIQTFVNVGVYTSSTGTPNIQFIGTAAVSNGRIVSVAVTNPGIGYTRSNPPKVVFDNPLPYSNIPLVYSQSSSTGFGTGAKVDIVVGNGSSVINFDIKNFGYGYGQGEVLTVDIGGIVGIPTDNSLTFSEFSLEIDRTTSDTFSGLFFGDLQIFDPLDDLFDGIRTLFPLTYNESAVSIKSRLGSLIEVQATLLVFLNDILQVPNRSYIFDGGSTILFTEAPKYGDTCRIIFYQGTSSVDIANVTPQQKIKIGDFVRITNESPALSQNDRIITRINSVDSVNTNNYPGPGISQNQSLLRTINLYRQTDDLFIDNKLFTKDRIINEPIIQPTTNIIQSVSVGSTEIYVESVKTFFDSKKEYLVAQEPQNKILVASQDVIVSASVTAIISSAGIVSSILITDGGIGYDPINPPSITIQNPIGFGSEYAARATTNVSVAGTVSSINIDFVGSGYTTLSSPVVLVEPPTPKSEVIDNISYSGDFGAVVGYGKTMIGISKYKIFDFHIPNNSILRDEDIVGTAVTISQIEIGDYFVIQNSNVSLTTETYTNYRNDDSVIGVSTQYIDGIYQVSNIQTITSEIVGIGTTSVKRVVTKSDDDSSVGLSTIGFGSPAITFDSTSYTFDYFDTSSLIPYNTVYYGGNFTWGKISNLNRTSPNEFNSYGIGGISTSASVIRFNPLKYNDYN